MVNNKIPIEKREKIEQLSKKGYATYRIAKITGTSRPTVQKYRNLKEKNETS